MITLNGKKVNLTKFPNGETHIDSNELENLARMHNLVGLKYESDADLVQLMFVKRHLDLLHAQTELIVYYMPYSRMDRTEGKKVFTLKYVADFINSLNFEQVTIFQPHSDVCTALINNSEVVEMSVLLLNEVIDKVGFDKEKDYIYYPDASAEKHFGKSNTYKSLVGLKQRDFETGRIKKLDVVGELPTEKGFKVVMVDDLSSYGGTFLLGASKLRELGATEIYLVVTHAEESIYKGDIFKTDLIDKVFTTDSIVSQIKSEKIDIKNLTGVPLRKGLTDYYLDDDNCYQRLKEEYKKYGKIIIAYDFDDTVFDFWKKGRTYNAMIELLKRWKDHAYFILYTASSEERYEGIKEYISKNNIPMDTINENIPNLNVPQGSKLYYNVLADDRAGIGQVYNMLSKLIEEIENGKI